MGVSMLGAVACYEFDSVSEAVEKIVSIRDTVQPEKELVEKYEQRYQKFKNIYPACRELFDKIVE